MVVAVPPYDVRRASSYTRTMVGGLGAAAGRRGGKGGGGQREAAGDEGERERVICKLPETGLAWVRCTCGTMSLIMKCDLIVKSSLLIMSPFGLIIRTMSQQ